MNSTMPKPKRNDASVKLDAEIVRRARLITDHSGASIAEYLSELLRPLVDRDYKRFKKQLQEEDEG